MTYSLNLLIIISILAFILFLVLMKLVQARKEQQTLNLKNGIAKEDYSLDALKEYINNKMILITTSNLYEENLTEEEFKRAVSRRNELKQALKNCNTGDISSKIYVRDYILELLKNDKKIDDTTIDYAIPFSTPSKMSAREKFETILYLVSKKEGYKALGWLIETFQLSEAKSDGGYRITEEEIDQIYESISKKYSISLNDKLRVVAQVTYSHYKGFGIIDEVRDMEIDGVSGGVSGKPERMNNLFTGEEDFSELISNYEQSTSLNSAWIMYRGKTIHLSFLSFEHESELRRVVTNVYKFGYPGQLSEINPAIINDMADGSRVTVIRPKLSESWVFFIRKKYNAKKQSLPELLVQKNSEKAISLLKFLIRGNRTSAITGLQGSGKTTLLMALIDYIRANLNLRIQETSSELNLRNQYPNRNILSMQETETYSGQDALDLSKKTDGDVTIVGEVATAEVAAWMVQTAQVASLFTLFTHHAKTLPNLVFDLRNSLLKTSMFSSERIAEQQVISVLEFDIHMRKDRETGERYIERISECIPIKVQDERETVERLAASSNRDVQMDVLMKLATSFFQQQTQSQQFIENIILEYRDGEYVLVNPISKERQKEILYELNDEEKEEFKAFISNNWGD